MDDADTQNLNLLQNLKLLEEIEEEGEIENPWPHINWESLPTPFYAWQLDALPIEQQEPEEE